MGRCVLVPRHRSASSELFGIFQSTCLQSIPSFPISCDDWYHASNPSYCLFLFLILSVTISDLSLQSVLLILIFMTAAGWVEKADIGCGNQAKCLRQCFMEGCEQLEVDGPCS